MENPFKRLVDAKNIAKFVGAMVIVALIVFETLIIVQYATIKPNWWYLIGVVASCIVLDAVCLLEMFAIKSFKARIACYVVDFVLLLIICTLTGNSYLSALYCAILTQFYVNVKDFKSKLAVFITSCVAYVATFLLGFVINYGGVHSYDSLIFIMTGCITGVVIMTTHFVISSFLLTFYNTNQKLTYALKEADESKTELKAAYEQLSEKAVYEERNRIARDIHDNAGHSMTAVIMQTEAAKVLIDTNPEEAKVRIISANLQAKNALDQMRESVHLLAGRSQVVSVKEELEEIIAQSMDGTDVKIRSDIIDVDLPADRRRFVCNCLKECLSNGIRHGGASAFYVELKRDEKQVTLIVSDNGSGLEPDFKEGYGIRGMREKAATYGGDISYESEQGEGVEVSIRVELV